MALNYNGMSTKALEAIGMKRCPFNPGHFVKASRFQKHISDCYYSMNGSDRNKWKVCLFNATHYVTVQDFDLHLIECVDNKSLIRELLGSIQKANNGSANRQVFKSEIINGHNNDIKIKDETAKEMVEEEVGPSSGPSVRPMAFANMAAEAEEDWSDPNAKEYIIYQKPEANKAQDFMDDDKYWLENDNFIDSMSYSRLPRSERRRLSELMVDRVKEQANLPAIKKHVDPHFTFQPVTRAVQQTEHSNVLELCNPVLNYLARRAELKPRAEPFSQPSLQSELHSVNIPIDYNRLVVAEAASRYGSTGLDACLRGIDLNKDSKSAIEVVVDRPLRLPKSNPFSKGLRKPNVGLKEDRN